MYTDPLFLACVVAWLALWAYWIAALRSQKTEKIVEPARARAGQILPMVVTYTLLFSPAARFGWLGRRVVPASGAWAWLGVWTCVAGVALALWARRRLGGNWSARVSIRTGHELVGAGPYRLIRHPIYTGMLLAVAGTALTLGEVRGALALATSMVAFYLKARKEEQWLRREFGLRFADHVARTGMFLPRLF
jgi:protein-S-isoprenylcysteine O-methyltransferase Ste14